MSTEITIFSISECFAFMYSLCVKLLIGQISKIESHLKTKTKDLGFGNTNMHVCWMKFLRFT